jgi:hypothetical protein
VVEYGRIDYDARRAARLGGVKLTLEQSAPGQIKLPAQRDDHHFFSPLAPNHELVCPSQIRYAGRPCPCSPRGLALGVGVETNRLEPCSRRARKCKSLIA